MKVKSTAKKQRNSELTELPQKIELLQYNLPKPTQSRSGLHLTEDRYAQAFHSNPDPVTITTIGEGCYVEVNEAFLEASGYERHEVIGRTALELNIWANPEDRDLLVQELRERGYIRRGKEVNFRGKSGEIRTYLYSTEIINISEEPHLLFVTKDITERKRFEEALRLSEDKFAKAFNASPISMAITSLEDGRIHSVNDSFCRILDYKREEILGRTSIDIGFWLDSVNRDLVKQKIANNESIRNQEIAFGANHGKRRLGLYTAEGIEISGERYILSIVNDITNYKQAEDEIIFLSFHDKLTGLYNRAYFEEKLVQMDTVRQLPISLIIGDVNGLKLVNEALGHHQGDLLLIAFADTIKKSCRQEDIVARWGGDEFIILLPGSDSQNAAKVLERIKDACSFIHTLPVQTSISLGMATKTHGANDIKKIIKEAEDKMYRNKILEAQSIRSSFLSSLQNTLWTRSHETEAHCRRLKEMVMMVGKMINLSGSEMDNLQLLAALHDIGKIAVPNNILDKPGKLTPEEWDTIQKHPEIGYRIALSSPEMAPIAEAILHHHERWDGSGYPQRLAGEAIPLLSRILAIADAYDVMVNGRPYQKAITHGEAWEEIKRCAGSQFDPELVNKALEIFI